MTFEAIYENGVLRPLAPLNLAEKQQVSLTLGDRATHDHSTSHADRPKDDLDELDPEIYDVEYMRWCRENSKDAPSLEEVRKMLSVIEGSMSDFIVEERRNARY
ncbi:MAG: antitoxin family protein [Pirellulales bacterium]